MAQPTILEAFGSQGGQRGSNSQNSQLSSASSSSAMAGKFIKINSDDGENLVPGGGKLEGKTRPQDQNTDLRKRVIRTNQGLTPQCQPDYLEKLASANMSINETTVGVPPRMRNYNEKFTRWVDDGPQLYQIIKDSGINKMGVLAMDFEFYINLTYDGFLAVASLSTPNLTLVIDCLNDKRQHSITVQQIINDLCENPNVLKVFCGGSGDFSRMRKDFHTFPVLAVDLQDMFVEWKNEFFRGCFAASRKALQLKATAKNKKADVSIQSLQSRLIEYNTPSLDFLMEVFNFPKDKDSKLTTTDWSRRPLSKDQINYSAIDAHYTMQIFYCIYEVIGFEGLKRALERGHKKLFVSPDVRPHKKQQPVTFDTLSEEIKKWRQHLAINTDWQPDQVLPAANVPKLALWMKEHKICENDEGILGEKLKSLGMRSKYITGAKLLIAFACSGKREEMKNISCRNCAVKGHIGLMCPFAPNKEEVKKLRSLPQNINFYKTSKEKRAQKLIARAENYGMPIDQVLAEMKPPPPTPKVSTSKPSLWKAPSPQTMQVASPSMSLPPPPPLSSLERVLENLTLSKSKPQKVHNIQPTCNLSKNAPGPPMSSDEEDDDDFAKPGFSMFGFGGGRKK